MNKHTPGPWKIRISDPPSGDWYYRIDGSHEKSLQTANANAALIEAAPELFEAAQFALNFLSVGGLAHNKLTAAIKKATEGVR